MSDISPLEGFALLGLSDIEATTYLALVQSGSSGATQLAEIVGIPRTSLYSALRSLSDAGLVEGGAGYAGRYQAVPPELALTGLIERERQELHERERVAKQLVEEVTALTDKSPSSDDRNVVDVLRSQRGIGDRLARLQLEATEQIHTFIRPPIIASRVDLVSRETAAALDRGVQIRELWALDTASEGHLKERIATGIDVRVATQGLPHKLAIFDRFTVLLPLETRDDPKPITALLIRSTAVASSFQTVFDTYWSTGIHPTQ